MKCIKCGSEFLELDDYRFRRVYGGRTFSTPCPAKKCVGYGCGQTMINLADALPLERAFVLRAIDLGIRDGRVHHGLRSGLGLTAAAIAARHGLDVAALRAAEMSETPPFTEAQWTWLIEGFRNVCAAEHGVLSRIPVREETEHLGVLISITVRMIQAPPDGPCIFEATATGGGRTFHGQGESELEAIGDVAVRHPERFGLLIADAKGQPIKSYSSGPV